MKMSRPNQQFVTLIDAGNDKPGVCYAKSRRRPYKGISDDYHANKLLEDGAIAKFISEKEEDKRLSELENQRNALIKFLKKDREFLQFLSMEIKKLSAS